MTNQSLMLTNSSKKLMIKNEEKIIKYKVCQFKYNNIMSVLEEKNKPTSFHHDDLKRFNFLE
jgi:hypothetical protein